MKSGHSVVTRLIPTILSLVIICLGGFGSGLLYKGYSALNAFSTDTSTSTYVEVNELWNSNRKTMDSKSVSELFSYLSSDGTIDGVQASTPQTATDIRGYTYGGKLAEQSVVVRLGGLDWIVTYLSTSDTGDKIATLWLSNNIQDAFVGRSQTEGEKYGYIATSVGTGLYSDWSYDWCSDLIGDYPSNMYSTSYIRVVTLNNGGRFATSNATLSNTYAKSDESVFAEFTIDNTTYSGDYDALTDYIVTPSNVSWQVKEQDSNLVGISNLLNNDSLTVGGNYSSEYDYSTKDYYSNWGNDYIWLPSLTETGYNESNIGMWEMSVEERKNYDGVTLEVSSDVAPGGANNTPALTYACSCTRSATYTASSMYTYINMPSSENTSNVLVNISQAVRPALHLNLSALANVITEPASVGIANIVHDNNVEPLNYNIAILDSSGVPVYDCVFQPTQSGNSSCTLIEGRTYKLVVQVPAGYSTSIQIGEQYYYTKVLSFTAIDGMSINVQARLRSQGWLDSVTVY